MSGKVIDQSVGCVNKDQSVSAGELTPNTAEWSFLKGSSQEAVDKSLRNQKT